MKIKTLLFAALLILSPFASAEWTVTFNKFTKTYDVSDGKQNPIHYKTEKAAKKAAKVLNKNDKKNEKKEGSSVVDFGDCPDQPGVVC